MTPTEHNITFRVVRPEEAAHLAQMMRAYYAFEELAFDEPKAMRMLAEFLRQPSYGLAWFIEADGAVAGYMVMCIGYSLEFGGRDAFVDEIFLHEPFRGRGIGRQALEHMIADAKRLGIVALHLEVDPENASARRLYGTLGFTPREGFMLISRRL